MAEQPSAGIKRPVTASSSGTWGQAWAELEELRWTPEQLRRSDAMTRLISMEAANVEGISYDGGSDEGL